MQIESCRCLSNFQSKQRGSTNVEKSRRGMDARALSLRAEGPVAGVAQAGDDEAVFVEGLIYADG